MGNEIVWKHAITRYTTIPLHDAFASIAPPKSDIFWPDHDGP